MLQRFQICFVLFLALVLLTSCSKGSFGPLSEQITPEFAEFRNGKIRYEYEGRIYSPSDYYASKDGKNYIAVNIYEPDDKEYSLSMSEFQALKKGDRIVVDRDTIVNVDYIETIDDWEDPYCSCEGTRDDNCIEGRDKGLYYISDSYCFIHPQWSLYDDGRLIIEGDDKDKLLLCRYYSKTKMQMYDAYDLVVSRSNLKWVACDELKEITFYPASADNNTSGESIALYDLPAYLSNHSSSQNEYYHVTLYSENGKITKMDINQHE